MGFWSAAVAIVAIIAFANLRAARYRGHSGNVGPDPAYTAQLEREVADLRKRLEVVERIVTDESETRRLANEIESLRER